MPAIHRVKFIAFTSIDRCPWTIIYASQNGWIQFQCLEDWRFNDYYKTSYAIQSKDKLLAHNYEDSDNHHMTLSIVAYQLFIPVINVMRRLHWNHKHNQYDSYPIRLTPQLKCDAASLVSLCPFAFQPWKLKLPFLFFFIDKNLEAKNHKKNYYFLLTAN